MNDRMNRASELSDEELMAIAYGKESEPTENKNSLPSLSDEDLYQKVGINPYDWEKPKSMSWMQAFLNTVRQGDGQAGLNSPAVRNFASGLGSGAYENVRGAAGLFGKEIPNQDFGGQPGFSRSLGELVGKYGPQLYMAGKATRLLPASMQSSILPQSGILGLLGGALEPGSYGEKAQKGLTDAALAASTIGLLKGAQKGSDYVGNFLDKVIPSRYDNKLNASIQSLTGGKIPSIESDNKFIYGNINKNFRKNQEKVEELYSKVSKLAKEKGYSDAKKISTEGLKLEDDSGILSSDMVFHDNKSQKALNFFLKDPSYENAHKLQSVLGVRSQQLKNMKGFKPLARELSGLRKQVKENIVNSFHAYGDEALANQYNKASAFYKKKVVPYRATAAIEKISQSKPELEEYDFPINPINTLKKNKDKVQKVVNELNDDARQALLARLLENKELEDPYKSLQKAYQDILSGPNKGLVLDRDINRMENLIKEGKQLRRTREFVRKNQVKIGLGALGALGLSPFIPSKK